MRTSYAQRAELNEEKPTLTDTEPQHYYHKQKYIVFVIFMQLFSQTNPTKPQRRRAKHAKQHGQERLFIIIRIESDRAPKNNQQRTTVQLHRPSRVDEGLVSCKRNNEM